MLIRMLSARVCLLLLLGCVFSGGVHGQTERAATIPIQDGVLHFETYGQGEPVVIINGGPGFNSKGFEPLARRIAAMGYQSILFDQRGTGKSRIDPVDSSTISLQHMAGDLEALRAHLGFEDWIVVGHSFGGMLGSYYAGKHPDRVRGLILSSSGGVDLSLLDGGQSTLFAQLTESEIDSLQFWRALWHESNLPEDRLMHNRYLARAYVVEDAHVETIAQRLMEGDLALNSMVWQSMIRSGYDCKPALASFDRPVLILHGQQDVVPVAIAQQADSLFQRSQLYLLEACGHYGWLDQEAAYFKAIERFLDGL